MLKTPNIAIIIPAAGASTRMGSPKQILPWGFSTLLGHAIETALASKGVKVFVVLGSNFDKIGKEIARYNISIIKNEKWQSGLGRSIAVGLEYILGLGETYDGVLIMLGDQPLIDTGYLNTLIDKFKIGEGQIIATSYSEEKQGVPAIFDRTYFGDLTLLNTDYGARELIKSHASKVIGVANVKALIDIDSKEDYKKYLK